jgi:hypothetical protein
MSKQLIFLTLPAIAEVIEDVLATEPYRFYQNFLVIPELQQKLIANMLRQIRDRYTVLIDDTHPSFNNSTTSLSSQQWLDMKEIVQQSIDRLLQEKRCDWDELIGSKRSYTEGDRANVENELNDGESDR